MKKFKNLIALVMVLVLVTPLNVLAEEHVCNLVNSVSQTVSSSEEYCKITTTIDKWECECGYQNISTYVENIPHDWEMVCVDKINNGYQRQCKTCGLRTGSISYPASMDITEEY